MNRRRIHRAHLHEHIDNKTGLLKYRFFLTNPSKPLDPAQTVWWEFTEGQSWFTDPDDCKFFIDLIRAGRNIGIVFQSLADAMKLLESLAPCEIPQRNAVGAITAHSS
jgi:hypothetical protein